MHKQLFVCFFCLFFCGCLHSYHVRENLAENQVLNPAIIRKPTGEKAWGILPVYEDFLEGYIQGGLIESGSQPVQGVAVQVQDEKGKERSEFTAGITDGEGVYRIRFSLPLRWNRVDFTGTLSCGSNWKILSPETKFRLYFSRRNGILAYSLKKAWLTVSSESGQPKTALTPRTSNESRPPLKDAPSLKKAEELPSPAQDKKKAEDLFGNFGFGP